LNQELFSTLNLHPDIIRNVATLGYKSMTPIQALTLPSIIEGKDVIGQAKTGSGKTAAFGLGVLHSLNVKFFRVQSLILCPTRELADQVAKEVRKLGRTIHNIKVLTLCGGVPMGPQVGSLEHGAHIVVGTPGRIEDHLRRGTLNLEHVNTLVLDEADRMLDMGFQSAIDMIIEQVPSQRQTLLFSATFPGKIQHIAQRIMKQPIMAKVEESHDSRTIEQYFYQIDHVGDRFTALQLLLLEHRLISTVVFCNTKRETQEVADQLVDCGFSALALHGDLEQKDRDKTLVRFANKSISILVATDVAARGLDIDSLDAVMNYHIARDPEIHVHRIGRTGRAGSKGLACSLFAEKEHYKISQLEKYLNLTVESQPLPATTLLGQYTYKPPMETIQIDGGKKQKVRAGDILGALTGDKGIAGTQVGKIDLFENHSYVAVHRGVADVALAKLAEGRLKGRSFKVRLL
jgi:ATP-independent RNA helicase DbpA